MMDADILLLHTRKTKAHNKKNTHLVLEITQDVNIHRLSRAVELLHEISLQT